MKPNNSPELSSPVESEQLHVPEQADFNDEREFLTESGQILNQVESDQDSLFTEQAIAESIRQIEGQNNREATLAIQEELGPLKEEQEKARNNFMKKARKFLPLFMVLFLQHPHGEQQYSNKQTAQEELTKYGVTRFQQKRYIPGVSEFLYRSVNPLGYDSKAENVIPNLVLGRENNPWLADHEKGPRLAGRNDAWRLYLGLAQQHNTFGISEYRPSKSKDDKYYFKINNFLEDYIKYCQREHEHWQENYGSKIGKEGVKFYVDPYDYYVDPNPIKQMLRQIAQTERIKQEGSQFSHDTNYDSASTIMGQYKLSQGRDEKGHYISYYDLWNLEGSPEGEEGRAGTPFEIYDRIYYDPVTYKILSPS